MSTNDYDKIMLSLKEKFLLRRILKRKNVPYNFFNDKQRDLFLKYGLITVQQKQIVTSTGRVCPEPNSSKYISTTDKAFRYFLYRKEAYFKGKLPVLIALAALIISIASFIQSSGL